MALQPFHYSKDWTRPEDFPAVAADSAQARTNIQLQPNEIRDHLNKKVAPAVNELEATVGELKKRKVTDDTTGRQWRYGMDNGWPYIEEAST